MKKIILIVTLIGVSLISQLPASGQELKGRLMLGHGTIPTPATLENGTLVVKPGIRAHEAAPDLYFLGVRGTDVAPINSYVCGRSITKERFGGRVLLDVKYKQFNCISYSPGAVGGPSIEPNAEPGVEPVGSPSAPAH